MASVTSTIDKSIDNHDKDEKSVTIFLFLFLVS